MFLYGNWLKLSIVTRMKIADKFGIKKTGTVHVFDNQVQSDGYSVKDVEKALNLNAIQSFLETQENDLVTIWNMLIDKIEAKTPLAKIEEDLLKQELPKVEEIKPVETLLPKLTPTQVEQAQRSLNIAGNKDLPKVEPKRKKRITKTK